MQNAFDKIIYKDDNVVLTTDKILFKGEHIKLTDVIRLAIDVKRTNTNIGWIFLIVGILMLLIGYVIPFSDQFIGLGLLYLGYIPISIGTTWLLWFRKKKYILILTTDVDKVNIVSSSNETYIKQLIDLIDKQIKDGIDVDVLEINNNEINKKEVVFIRDKKVTVTNLFFTYGERTFDFSLLEETKVQVDRNREKLGIILFIIGLGTVYFNYSEFHGSDSQIAFGTAITILGTYFFFNKRYTVRININGQKPFNSIISKDVAYCNEVDAAIQEAMEYNQSLLSK